MGDPFVLLVPPQLECMEDLAHSAIVWHNPTAVELVEGPHAEVVGLAIFFFF